MDRIEQAEKKLDVAHGDALGNADMRRERTMRFVTLGMFAAISIALVYALHFPLLPTAPFLEYDPADVSILIASFAFGPWWGLLLTFVVSVIQGVTVSAGSGIWGIVMHFLSTGIFVVVAGSIYRPHKTRKRALVALTAGLLLMTIAMIPLNYFIDPLYLGCTREFVVTLLIPAILPFNLLKGFINAAITFILYKHVSRLIKRVSGSKTIGA